MTPSTHHVFIFKSIRTLEKPNTTESLGRSFLRECAIDQNMLLVHSIIIGVEVEQNKKLIAQSIWKYNLLKEKDSEFFSKSSNNSSTIMLPCGVALRSFKWYGDCHSLLLSSDPSCFTTETESAAGVAAAQNWFVENSRIHRKIPEPHRARFISKHNFGDTSWNR